jgi:hypothetical protein
MEWFFISGLCEVKLSSIVRRLLLIFNKEELDAGQEGGYIAN